MSEKNTTVTAQKSEKPEENTEIKRIRISDTIIRVVVYGFITIVLAAIMLYKPMMNKFNISQAEKCYNAQNYVCAFKFYRAAFANRIDNEAYVEHYFQTLTKMKKIAVVQEELINLAEDYPNNKVVPEIEAIFSVIQKKLTDEYKENYIDHVVQGTNVVHWNNVRSKVNVYIDMSLSSELPGYYFGEIKKALADYTVLMENALQFYYVKDRAEADIEIIFMPEISGGKCVGSSNCARILGLTETDISGSVLKRVRVKLRTKDTDNSQFTANQIHNIVKHELGHALGIAGHSYFSEDVMYPVNNDAKWAEDTATLLIKRKPFSQRDINTFRLLYKTVPDITNKRYDAAVHSDMYFPMAVIGTREAIGKKKLEESSRYMKAVSSNFISQMNMAEGHFVNKDYESAKEAFSEALTMAKTDEEKFTVYHNLAVIAYEQNDYKTALSYAEMANTYSPEKKSNEIKAYCYIETAKHARAQRLLEKLLETNPDNATYSAALVGSYLKQFKFLKMFKELKRMKQINPDAFAEPAFQPYSFFTGMV